MTDAYKDIIIFRFVLCGQAGAIVTLGHALLDE
jgi:hypothetical protein